MRWVEHYIMIIKIDAFHVDGTVTTATVVSLVDYKVTTCFELIENNNHNK